jgi:translation initiation factor 2B subunit (eIF-2B alpha/beta/delta family)
MTQSPDSSCYHAAVDRILRRQLDAIARDRTSGAAELVGMAVGSVSDWLQRNPKPSTKATLVVVRELLKARWDMAPFFRFANDLALSIDATDRPKTLSHLCHQWKEHLRTAQYKIAEHFEAAVRNRRLPKGIVTYSYSSTVVRALIRARSRIKAVTCSEARPALEGRKTAHMLARAGIRVSFRTDAALMDAGVLSFENVVLGADEVTSRWFVSKIGAATLALSAIQAGRPVWVLTDTSKFRPWLAPRFLGPAPMRTPSSGEVWQRPPKRVLPWNPLFIRIGLRRGLRFLTEKGWMSPAKVRREIAKVKVSSRLKEMLHSTTDHARIDR